MLKKIWDDLEETLLIWSYLLVVPLLFVQVVSRYVFNHSLTWSEELVRYVFIWQIWLGSSYCVKENRHIRIDVFTDRLSPSVRRAFETFITVICIVFCCFMIYKGQAVMGLVMRMDQKSPAMELPMYFVYSCIPISCALMIVRYVERLFKMRSGGKGA